jgi:hypothetical protein
VTLGLAAISAAGFVVTLWLGLLLWLGLPANITSQPDEQGI